MRAAVIVDGRVDNIIEVDAIDMLEDVTLVEAPSASIGDLWDGEQFITHESEPAPIEVPQSVAMWQARAIMIEDEILDDVNAELAKIPDEKARKLALAKFEYSSTVRRDDPLVKFVIPKLGKSEAEIDQMFIRAAGL